METSTKGNALICKKTLKRVYHIEFIKGQIYFIEGRFDGYQKDSVFYFVKTLHYTQMFTNMGGKKNLPNIHNYFDWLPLSEVRKIKLEKINGI